MTTVVGDPSEVWGLLVDAWRVDDSLTALLGAPNAVFRGYPATAPKLPSLIIEWQALNPKPSTGYGVFNPTLQVSVYSKDRDLGGQIFAQLQQTWQIPTQRPTALVGENYRLTQLMFLEPVLIGPFRSDEYNDDIFHCAIAGRAKVERYQPD